MSTLPKLRVWDEAGHPCRGRYLVTERGEPFFYLGDTAWELFHRLTREEADLYLKDRAAKGFTVIQAVALAELDGLNTPNAYGDTPLHRNDPAQPNEAYFRHVDWVIDRANARARVHPARRRRARLGAGVGGRASHAPNPLTNWRRYAIIFPATRCRAQRNSPAICG